MAATKDFIFVWKNSKGKTVPFVALKGHESLSWCVKKMTTMYTGGSFRAEATSEEVEEAFWNVGFQVEPTETGFHIWNETDDVQIQGDKIFVNGEPFLTEAEKESLKAQKSRELLKSVKETLETCKIPDDTLLICRTNQMMQILAKSSRK